MNVQPLTSDLRGQVFCLMYEFSLPRAIRCIIVPFVFKHRLKVELFSRAYDISLGISEE